MLIVLAIFGLLLIILLIGKMNLTRKFNRQVAMLLSNAKNTTGRKFKQEQIRDLPQPVQRYFRHVLKDDQPYIDTIRFTHAGQFKPGIHKAWVNIKGEQYVTTDKPGFIWKGTTLTFVARDLYLKNKGRLIVLLLSLIKVVDGKGKHYDEGELIRWLGESVLYPTNLLPDERLKWSPIDDNSAKLIFRYNGMSLEYLVTFNATGEIIQLETKRYMDQEKLATWIIKLENYKEMSGVKIPTTTEVFWRLKDGDFSYARFLITKVEYNLANRIPVVQVSDTTEAR